LSIQAVPITIDLPNLRAQAHEEGREFTILDLETTTFGGPTFGITECATLTISDNEQPVLRAGLVNPQNPISWQAEQKTGITQAMVRGKPHWGEAWAHQLMHLARDGRTSGWGSKSFDLPRLRTQQQRYGLPELPMEDHVDGYLVASRLRGDKKGDLSATAAKLGIPWTDKAHRAPADVIMTALVLEKLCVLHGRVQVFGGKPAATRQAPSKTQAATPADLDILRIARTLPFYEPQRLAEILSTDIGTLERKISDLIKDGADPVPFTCHKTQAWLKEVLPEVLPGWTGRKFLRDLMNDLNKHPKAQPGLSYVQIRVALACAGTA